MTTATITSAVIIVLLTACDKTPGSTDASAIVVSTEAERDGTTTTTHYADCALPTGEQYRVKIPAAMEYQLHNGQPCPDGPQLPMPYVDHHLESQLMAPMPYRGGDPNGPCGTWETNDKQVARWDAQHCPPLRQGDIR